MELEYVTAREFDRRMRSMERLIDGIDEKQDAQSAHLASQSTQLTRLETKFDDGILAGRKQTAQYASVWSVLVSGGVVGVWQLIKAHFKLP